METPEFCTPSHSPTPSTIGTPMSSTALHVAVFEDDVAELALLIKSDKTAINSQDTHGNTPLHLAVMLGRHNCVSLLISADAIVKIRNRQGWNCVMESVSYGDRIIISALLRLLKEQSRAQMKSRKPHLIDMLEQLDDFYLELKWQFHSWIPLISRILPSDVCKIYKRGACLRLDTTLVDFNERSWERGDVSFVFNASAADGDQLVMLDNKAHCFQRVKYDRDEEEKELAEEVDMLMSNDIVNVQMSTKTVHFNRQVAGWVFRQNKSEAIGDYSADVYSVDGLYVVSHKRREHLTPDDLKNNKSLLTNFQRGKLTDQDVANATTKSRATIAPPPSTSGLTFADYEAADSDECIGRPRVHKTNKKHIKATAAMSTEFPLDVGTLLDVLEVVAPLKHVDKLRKFCRLRMPPGFPVRLDIPIFPTVTATVTFQHMQIRNDIDPKMFEIPKHYKLTTKRFPDL